MVHRAEHGVPWCTLGTQGTPMVRARLGYQGEGHSPSPLPPPLPSSLPGTQAAPPPTRLPSSTARLPGLSPPPST